MVGQADTDDEILDQNNEVTAAMLRKSVLKNQLEQAEKNMRAV